MIAQTCRARLSVVAVEGRGLGDMGPPDRISDLDPTGKAGNRLQPVPSQSSPSPQVHQNLVQLQLQTQGNLKDCNWKSSCNRLQSS